MSKVYPRNSLRKQVVISILALVLGVITASLAVAHHYLYNHYSNDAAVEHLTQNAKRHSVGLCALYVRQAIEAGGCPTFYFPGSACKYDEFLPDLGFERVDEEGYVPQKGDIAVFAAAKGHKHGHICMYDGHQWVSDFKQHSMYVAAIYYSSPHSFWRRPDGGAWRKIHLHQLLN